MRTFKYRRIKGVELGVSIDALSFKEEKEEIVAYSKELRNTVQKKTCLKFLSRNKCQNKNVPSRCFHLSFKPAIVSTN